MMLSSLQNPSVKEAVKLKNRKTRDETGLFLIEGYRELKRAIDGGVEVEKIFSCQELFLGENEEDLIQSSEAEKVSCSEPVFRKMSYRDRPDGLLAVAKQMRFSLTDFEKQMGETPLLVIAEAIEKPGNLGSILRSSDGVGADGVIVCDRCTDIYNPNVVRASVGTLFTIPVIETSSEEAFAFLKRHGIQIVATSPAASQEFTEADLKGPTAIVMGTEQLGLSEYWLGCSDLKVSIPMKGTADSLNVATATTLMLYEVLRQRELS